MPPGIGYGNPQHPLVQAMMAQGQEPAGMGMGGGMGENPLEAILALLQAPQEAPSEYPQPPPVGWPETIGAIILGALGDQTGPARLDQRRQQILESQQAGAAQSRLFGQAQGQQRNSLMNTLLDHLAAQGRETGLLQRFEEGEAGRNQRLADTLASRDALQADRLTAAERVAQEREGRLRQEFIEREGRLRDEFGQGMAFKQQEAAARNARFESELAHRKDMLALRRKEVEGRVAGLKLPGVVGREMVDFAASIQGAQDVLDFLEDNGDVGGPGAAIGGVAFTADQDLLKAMLSDVTTLIGNLRSGAAITEAEFKRLSALLPAVNSRYRQKIAGMKQVKTFLERKFRGRQALYKMDPDTIQQLRDVVSGVPAIFEDEEATTEDEDFGGL